MPRVAALHLLASGDHRPRGLDPPSSPLRPSTLPHPHARYSHGLATFQGMFLVKCRPASDVAQRQPKLHRDTPSAVAGGSPGAVRSSRTGREGRCAGIHDPSSFLGPRAEARATNHGARWRFAALQPPGSGWSSCRNKPKSVRRRSTGRKQTSSRSKTSGKPEFRPAACRRAGLGAAAPCAAEADAGHCMTSPHEAAVSPTVPEGQAAEAAATRMPSPGR
jgi:hypothetical protein